MTPRGGPTLDFSLFGRYFLDLAVFYPGAFLCLAPLWEHVKAPRRTAVLTAALVTVICLAAAASAPSSNSTATSCFCPPAGGVLAAALAGGSGSFREPDRLSLRRLRRHDGSLLPAFRGAHARAEVGNDAPACLVSTSLLKLGLSAVLCIIFWFTAVQWSRWLLREYRGEASGSRRGRCPPSTRLSSSSACRWTRPSCSSTV